MTDDSRENSVAATAEVRRTLRIKRTPAALVAPVVPVQRASLAEVLEEVYLHLGRYVRPTDVEHGLVVITLWVAHTYLVEETYTSPRLLLDSPVPGAGKTTVLDHLQRLACRAVMTGSVTASALSRVNANGPMTVLIDEVDRVLDPRRDTSELLTTINTGYRRGGSRLVSVQSAKSSQWNQEQLSTFGAVVMSGISPLLPADTLSRCIRVGFMPDVAGSVEESRWERIEEEVVRLGERLAAACELVRQAVRDNDSPSNVPSEIKGRDADCWLPLIRVADAAGGRWPEEIREIAPRYVLERMADSEDGLEVERPHVTLVRHLAEMVDQLPDHIATVDLIRRLAAAHPEMWAAGHRRDSELTPQALGRMMRQYGLRPDRATRDGRRGYQRKAIEAVLRRMGLLASRSWGTGATGATGDT